MSVRAFYTATAVPGFESPYNVLNLKVFYPARFDDSEEVRNLGIVPPDESAAPYPVVLFFSGVNVAASSYAWLGAEFANRGIVFVSFDWVTDTLPGGKTGLTPGIDLSALTPDAYGSKPTAIAMPSLLKELQRLNEDSLLSGLLDLRKLILGGHSAGGSTAIMNARRAFFPEVIGAFAYGSHSQGATMLGFEPDTFLPLSSRVPILIAGGSNDGVISSSARRYGKEDGDCIGPLIQTFESGLKADSPRFAAIFDDSNHFLIADPVDHTTGRSYLDNPESDDVGTRRQALAQLILAFVQSMCLGSSAGDIAEIGDRLLDADIVSEFLSN